MGLLPYKGEIEWKSEIKIGYVPQRLPFIKDIPLSVNDFFKLKQSSEKETKEILNSVGFKEDFLEKKNRRFVFGTVSENIDSMGSYQKPAQAGSGECPVNGKGG